jgi:rubrerythrin
MTNAEAIEILKLRRGCAEYVDCMYVDSEDIDAIDMAIAALEKQEGKKPFWNGAFYECPNCNTSFGDNDERPMYCDICGQRIEWGG